MGDRYERQLVNALTDCGRPALRAPTSGSATDRRLPDVLSGERVEMDGFTGPVDRFSRVWAIEVKTTSDTTAYADASEVQDLCRFAEMFGAVPYLAARFKRPGGGRSPFYLITPYNARETEGGLYGLPESDARDRAAYMVYPESASEDAIVMEVGDP